MENLNYLVFCLFFINLIFIKSYKFIEKKYDLYDKPDETRKKQPKPVPLLGGLLFLINIFTYFFYEYFFNSKSFFYTLGFLGEIKIFLFSNA